MARFTFPTSARRTISQIGDSSGSRTFLIVPLRQQGELIGTLIARRTEVRPFTPAQIKLLETFADQAVIAIENVRLFQELQGSRLEQQTATSEILGVIASSPTDIQPVLDVIAENAAACAGARCAQFDRVEGRCLRIAAHYGSVPNWTVGENSPLIAARSSAERSSTERRFMSMTFEQCQDEFPECQGHAAQQGFGPCLPRRCCAKGRHRRDRYPPHGSASFH